MHEQADDAAALIDELAAAPAIVIGRSYGGAIAIDLALRYPDRVRALVLLEGDVPSVSETAAREVADITKRILAAAEADMGSVAQTLMRDVLGDAGWEGLPEEANPYRQRPGARRRGPRRLSRRDRETRTISFAHAREAMTLNRFSESRNSSP